MVVLLFAELLAAVLAVGIADWVSNNPIVAAVLAVLLALVFFLYLMIRRSVQGFKEGMQGGRNR